MESTRRTIVVDGMPLDVADYAFEKAFDGFPAKLSITGFFVLPDADAQVHARIEALQAASRSPTAVGLGSAQVQVLTRHEFSDQEWNQILQSFLGELVPVIEVIGGGVDDRMSPYQQQSRATGAQAEPASDRPPLPARSLLASWFRWR